MTIIRQDPKEFVLTKGGDRPALDCVKALYEADGSRLEMKNSFILERGDYLLAAVMDESVSDTELVLEGCYIDIFDPELPVISCKKIAPGSQALLVDMSKVEGSKPRVVASASRESDEVYGERTYSFIAKGPVETKAVTRVLLPSKPLSVTVDGKDVSDGSAWDAASRTYLVKYDNSPDGKSISFRW